MAAPETDKVESFNMTAMIDIVFQLLIFFMLTMNFPQVEGALKAQLPKDKGLASSSVPQPELQEVRVVICAGGDTRMHINNKGEHEKVDKSNETCKILVEKVDIGDVFHSAKMGDKAGKNRDIYKQCGAKVKELFDATPSTKDPTKRAPVIIDADSEVPYEHVVGVVNACKEEGIETIEFVGNPRWDLYYGAGTKGQFQKK